MSIEDGTAVVVECLEEWRVIPDHARYEASSWGRIRRPERTLQPLKPWPIKKGYLYVSLSEEGVVSNQSVHDLVAQAFLGPKPDGYTVDHIDRVRANNRADNLQYLLAGENSAQGARNPERRWELSPEEVRSMRAALAEGTRLWAVARRFNVSLWFVTKVKRRKIYPDV